MTILHRENTKNLFNGHFKFWVVSPASSLVSHNGTDPREETKREYVENSPSNRDEAENLHEQRRYNLKKLTSRKTEQQIDEMIFAELGIEPNPLCEWNRMINRISKLSMENSEVYNSETEEIEIGQEQNKLEHKVAPSVNKLLSYRQKGQRLTYHEKLFIFELIRTKQMPREVIIDKYCIRESTLKRITALFDSGQY